MKTRLVTGLLILNGAAVRTYHNPAGRICAVVVPDAFGG
jgi:hypothetical protein